MSVVGSVLEGAKDFVGSLFNKGKTVAEDTIDARELAELTGTNKGLATVLGLAGGLLENGKDGRLMGDAKTGLDAAAVVSTLGGSKGSQGVGALFAMAAKEFGASKTLSVALGAGAGFIYNMMQGPERPGTMPGSVPNMAPAQ